MDLLMWHSGVVTPLVWHKDLRLFLKRHGGVWWNRLSGIAVWDGTAWDLAVCGRAAWGAWQSGRELLGSLSGVGWCRLEGITVWDGAVCGLAVWN